MNTIIEELEQQVETLRRHNEALRQAVLLGNGDWDCKIAPLTLYQTRAMRLIARGNMLAHVAVRILAHDYPNTSLNSFDAILVHIRRRVPYAIAPVLRAGKFEPLAVPDPVALKAFLQTGVLPEAGRLAA